jgi:cytochrome c556
MRTPPALSPRFRVAWIVFAASAVFLLGAVHARDNDAEDAKHNSAAAKAAPDVLEVVDCLADGGDMAKGAKAQAKVKVISRTHEFEAIMWQFTPRDKGGLGIGAKPAGRIPDGIEVKIIALANLKKPLKAEQFAAEQPDLQRMAETIRAVSFIAKGYGPKLEGRGWVLIWNLIRAVVWRLYCDDMESNSQSLLDAIKAGDSHEVQKASNRLLASCISCHNSWR